MEYLFTSYSLLWSGNAILERENGVGDGTQQKFAVPDPLPAGTTSYAPPGARRSPFCTCRVALVARPRSSGGMKGGFEPAEGLGHNVRFLDRSVVSCRGLQKIIVRADDRW